MSPSWTPELRVGLAPSHAAVARTPRGLFRRTSYKRFETPGEPAAALEAVLAQVAPFAGDLTVVLSSRYCRHALLPWSDALADEAEWLAFAAHSFEAVHGKAARGWTCTVAAAPSGKPRMASAIDTALLDGLRAAVAKQPGVRLVSLQPYLAAAFNRVRATIGRRHAWLAVVDDGRVLLGLVKAGEWAAIRTRQLPGAQPEQLQALVERETALLGETEAPETLLVVGGELGGIAKLGALRVEDLTLRPGMALDARRLALALA